MPGDGGVFLQRHCAMQSTSILTAAQNFLAKKLQSSNFVHGLATRTTNFYMTNCPTNGRR